MLSPEQNKILLDLALLEYDNLKTQIARSEKEEIKKILNYRLAAIQGILVELRKT